MQCGLALYGLLWHVGSQPCDCCVLGLQHRRVEHVRRGQRMGILYTSYAFENCDQQSAGGCNPRVTCTCAKVSEAGWLLKRSDVATFFLAGTDASHASFYVPGAVAQHGTPRHSQHYPMRPVLLLSLFYYIVPLNQPCTSAWQGCTVRTSSEVDLYHAYYKPTFVLVHFALLHHRLGLWVRRLTQSWC